MIQVNNSVFEIWWVNMISFIYEEFTLFPSGFFKAFKSNHSFWRLQFTLFCFQYVLGFTLNKVDIHKVTKGSQHFMRRPTYYIPVTSYSTVWRDPPKS